MKQENGQITPRPSLLPLPTKRRNDTPPPQKKKKRGTPTQHRAPLVLLTEMGFTPSIILGVNLACDRGLKKDHTHTHIYTHTQTYTFFFCLSLPLWHTLFSWEVNHCWVEESGGLAKGKDWSPSEWHPICPSLPPPLPHLTVPGSWHLSPLK